MMHGEWDPNPERGRERRGNKWDRGGEVAAADEASETNGGEPPRGFEDFKLRGLRLLCPPHLPCSLKLKVAPFFHFLPPSRRGTPSLKATSRHPLWSRLPREHLHLRLSQRGVSAATDPFVCLRRTSLRPTLEGSRVGERGSQVQCYAAVLLLLM